MHVRPAPLLTLLVLLSLGCAPPRMGTPAVGLDVTRPTFVSVSVRRDPSDPSSAYELQVGVTEITQRQWRDVMGTSPSYRHDCDDCPVEFVSWYDAAAFANALSERDGLPACYEFADCSTAAPYQRGVSGGDQECHEAGLSCAEVSAVGTACQGYRLPQRPEWNVYGPVAEVAANWRRGPRYAVIKRQNLAQVNVVASLQPNEHGLYDTLGNVREWFEDRASVPSDASRERLESAHPVWFLSAATSYWTLPRRISADTIYSDLGSWGCAHRGLRVVRTVVAP
jgi:formylglycine-generating enzyme required for sulfatase activity